MPNPSSSLATLSPALQTFYEASYAELSSQFIGPQVLPALNVPKQAGTFGKIPLEELLKKGTPISRAPGSGYKRDNFQFTSDSYATIEYGVEEIIDDREAEMYSDYLPAVELAAQRAAFKVLAAAEARVASVVANFTLYNGTAALNQAVTNGQWSTLTTSTPISDVNLAVGKFYANTGMWPNAIIMNRKTFRILRQTTQVLNAIKSDGAGDRATLSDVTTGQLSAVFDIPNVIVAGGSQNTAAIGAAATIGNIWPDHVMVCKIATGPDMREPCIGRSFHWSADGSSMMGAVEQYRDDRIRANIIRVRQDVAEKRLYDEMAVMIPSAVA